MKKSYLAQLLLRCGFIAVFAWFGASQIAGPAPWAGLIPAWITRITGISASTLVIVNGIGEVALALLLALNIFVPIVAALGSIHILIITTTLGFNDIGIRDLGLALSLAALAVLAREERVVPR